jgi:glycerol-3-phosphate dehydrogenase
MTAPGGSALPAVPRGPLLPGPFDLAVIGGGINGAGIARDAALRGKTVVLLERGDFGSGTSSRSSKMVHGGIRYLEQLRLGLVHEALRERSTLIRIAPHLVKPQSFVLPFYEGARRSARTLKLGLRLYDLLALGRRIGKSRGLDRDEVIARVPGIRAEGLAGGGIYHDGIMDDARLVLANILACGEVPGAPPGSVVVRSYAEAASVRPGSPAAILVRDRVTGEESEVLAHRVVRAAGPWTDPSHLVRSKGVHLVLPSFPGRDGLLLTHSKDGRVFFCVPWLGRTVVGTTETPFDGSLDALEVEREEAAYLLEEVRRVLPGLEASGRHILGPFAGVRPLARAAGWFRSGHPGSVSRVHRIVEDAGGVLSVFGGKYTTYRAVAKEVCDRLYPASPCSTARLPLPGGEGGPWSEFRTGADAEIARIGDAEALRLFEIYGARMLEVLRLAAAEPGLAARLSPEHPTTRAEAVYGVLREHVTYPEDFLARRASLRFTPDGGRSAYDAVEEIIRARSSAIPRDLAAARERYFAEIEREDRLREALS